jgi:hypothetical protein
MADKFTTLMFPNTKGTKNGSWALRLVCSMEMVKCVVRGMAVYLKSDSELGKYSILRIFNK